MQVIHSIHEMQSLAIQMRTQGKLIGCVPTMGCLHEGHLRLVDIIKEKCDVVVLSIFVNPTQFGPNEDYERYPRAMESDLAMCEGRGVDIVFAPKAEEMYPANFSTYVNEELCSRGLCGDFRPGHFRGVATVVLMLFNIIRPDVAVFGQKDAQQVALIKKMVSDLFVPVTIQVAPIVREEDGLAKSSRNTYLSAPQRKVAPEIFAALQLARTTADGGEHRAKAVCDVVQAHLGKFPDFRPQYISIVDSTTMQPVEEITPGQTLLAVAVALGTTRLIDNIQL
ncbi:MAG: pantoate--beta-alanine ligase [Puniceicoccales bacterium]|jgi:pantoate--beta-alanine ligase|nr:pantoate--beta-alanine ligase [Puniceicoccales bacterium]